MLPCMCAIYWAAWLYRVPAYSRAISSIARQNWYRNEERWWNADFMKSVRAKGKCLYSFIKLSWLYLWFLLHILCTYGHGATWETLVWAWDQLPTEAWEDCFHQPSGQWHCSHQKPGVVTCCISENKTAVTNLLKGLLQWTLKGWPFLVMYRILSICSCRLQFQQSLVNLISSGFFPSSWCSLLFRGLTNSRNVTILSIFLLLVFSAKHCRSTTFM